MTAARVMRLAALLATVAAASTGCRGCLRENLVYEHCLNRPDTRPCPRPCPPLIPEFEGPPVTFVPPMPRPPVRMTRQTTVIGKGAGDVMMPPPPAMAPDAGAAPRLRPAPVGALPDEVSDK